MENNLKRAKIITTYFNLYGYGNFDLSLEEVAHILEIVASKDLKKVEEDMKKLYDRLYRTRMG